MSADIRMTTSATGPISSEITARLTAALQPGALVVVNDSALHQGHHGDNGSGETHFTVSIESAAFAGLSRVARQRLVHRALADLLAGPIHALAIQTYAPGEWQP